MLFLLKRYAFPIYIGLGDGILQGTSEALVGNMRKLSYTFLSFREKNIEN